jgi:Domain of unknown function (DUF6468)
MDVLTDGLLMTATLFAGGYCWVLARRVRDLKSLDKGLGGAIVTLTRQVELARTTLEEARAATGSSRDDLGQLIARAETVAGQIRLLLASVEEPRHARPAPPRAPTAAAVPPTGPARPSAGRPPLVLDEAEPDEADASAAGAAESDPALPKPRALPPLDNPLRRRTGHDDAPPRSEEEILRALTSMAANGGR